MKTTLSFLLSNERPWISIGRPESGADKWIPAWYYNVGGDRHVVRELRGKRMRTTAQLMSECGAAFQFFEGFGENWFALADCLELLDETLPAKAYTVIITKPQLMLAEDGVEAFDALLRTMHETSLAFSQPVGGSGRFDRPAVPFHWLIFNEDASQAAELARWTSAGQRTGVPLRML